MMTGFFRDLPRELEESAEIDGCGRIQALLRVVVPLARPGLAVTAIYTFIFAWQQFLLPLILTSSTNKYLMTTATAFFIQEHGVQWGQMTAIGSLATLPSLLFALMIQKHIIRGISFGAIKG
jgi:multiple sugar transport system permease protein